jgi:exopolysaccharide/PEP-CTERM locus tyrosine autokinase
MGKIYEAMTKYSDTAQRAGRDQPPRRVALNQSDLEALINYDRETGHLVRYDRQTGQVDMGGIEALRKQGSIQRLLENELIYAGGKLTRRGLAEVQRLQRIVQHRKAAAAPGVEPKPDPAEPVIAAVQQGESGRELPTQAGPSRAAEEAAPPDVQRAAPAGDKPEDEFIVAFDAPAQKAEPSPAEREPVVDAHPPAASAPAVRSGLDSARVDRTLVALTNPHSTEAEQFKILRTNLLYPVSGHPPRSILITSAAPGEGKSFAAANLAISIAMNINRYVLLIDADMRRPDLHRRFGLGEVPGLSNYLMDGTALPSLLQKTQVEKLTLLPAGRSPANPSELISSERMVHLLSEVSSRYNDRLIVVDAPPLSIAAESSVLARQVEGILVVVRHGKTKREEVINLLSRVEEEKLLGCFLNGVDRSISRYYGYYDYNGDKRPRA